MTVNVERTASSSARRRLIFSAALVAALALPSIGVNAAVAPSGQLAVVGAEYAARSGAAVSANDNRFLSVGSDGKPARWNPCEVHPIVINSTGMPRTAIFDLRKAIEILNKATGLKFKIVASTKDRVANYSYAKTKDGWPPVLVQWANQGSFVLGNGTRGVLGITNAAYITRADGVRQIVSGTIVFSTEHVAGFKPAEGFSAGTLSRGQLMLHELGHLVGLAHRNAGDAVMSGHWTKYSGVYQAAELADLKFVGSTQGCIED